MRVTLHTCGGPACECRAATSPPARAWFLIIGAVVIFLAIALS